MHERKELSAGRGEDGGFGALPMLPVRTKNLVAELESVRLRMGDQGERPSAAGSKLPSGERFVPVRCNFRALAEN